MCVCVYPFEVAWPLQAERDGDDKEGMRKREGTQRRERERERAFRVKKSVRAREKKEILG